MFVRTGNDSMAERYRQMIVNGFKDSKYGEAETRCAENNTAHPIAVRGGSWFYRPAWVRTANRDTNARWRRHLDGGFRLVSPGQIR